MNNSSYIYDSFGQPVGYDYRSYLFDDKDKPYEKHVECVDVVMGDKWKAVHGLRDNQNELLKKLLERLKVFEYRAKIYFQTTNGRLKCYSEVIVNH